MPHDTEPLATINEPDGSRLDIFLHNPWPEEGEPDVYDAVRTAADGTETTPQNMLTAEEMIRYLAHMANGYSARRMM